MVLQKILRRFVNMDYDKLISRDHTVFVFRARFFTFFQNFKSA